MNTVQSQSRIVDADFSVETTNLTRNTVLQQAATSMLAQANAQKNSILALIPVSYTHLTLPTILLV